MHTATLPCNNNIQLAAMIEYTIIQPKQNNLLQV